MITGFITDQETAQAVNDGAEQAQKDRGQPVYWRPGMFKIHAGPHAGEFFIPFDETVRATVLVAGKTVEDFPEFEGLVSLLGGESATVSIDPQDIVEPESQD